MVNFRRRLIISFSIIVASIAIAGVVLFILAGSISDKVAAIQKDRAIIGQSSGQVDAITQLKAQSAQAAAYQAAIGQILPTQDGLIGFSSWVDQIAGAHHVIANTSFSGTPQPSGLPTQPGQAAFSLEASGSFADLAAFLNDMEANQPGFLVKILSFTIAPDNGGDRLTGQGTVFFRS